MPLGWIWRRGTAADQRICDERWRAALAPAQRYEAGDAGERRRLALENDIADRERAYREGNGPQPRLRDLLDPNHARPDLTERPRDGGPIPFEGRNNP